MKPKHSHNFDAVATWYDTIAAWVFGKSIRQAQLDTIGYIPDGAEVLIIGGGTGWYLQELLARKKLQKVVYLEASEQMLQLARKKVEKFLPEITLTTLELRLGTENNLHPGERFDVVITHFFLDIFAPARLQQVIHLLRQALHPDGLWLIADFKLSKDNSGIWYWYKKILVKCMYFFFRLVCRISGRTLPDFGYIFTQLGLRPVYKKYFYRGLIFSAVYTSRSPELQR